MLEATIWQQASVTAAITAAGVFFLTGLLTGVWKYLQIRQSDTATAHVYVDIVHRASLMYSFAAILLVVFAGISQLPQSIELPATLAQLLFFAMAIVTYLIHGVLADTDNQLKRPHRLGKHRLPSAMIGLFMWSLVIAEVGGFLVLFYGVLQALYF